MSSFLVECLVRWGRGERKGLFKMFSALAFALLFLVALPLAMWLVSAWTDQRLGLLSWPSHPASLASGLLLAVLGLFLIGWSAWAQHKLGRGGPTPLAPTRRLVTSGPYGLCRNPMALGELLYLTGLALLLRSPSFMLLTWAILLPAIVAYLKLVEEKELEARFGEAYWHTSVVCPSCCRGPGARGGRATRMARAERLKAWQLRPKEEEGRHDRDTLAR